MTDCLTRPIKAGRVDTEDTSLDRPAVKLDTQLEGAVGRPLKFLLRSVDHKMHNVFPSTYISAASATIHAMPAPGRSERRLKL